MGDFYSHDWMDDDDEWLYSREERERLDAKYNARTAAEGIRGGQQYIAREKKSIISELDKMDIGELILMQKIASKIKEYKIFFKMFKEL